MGGVGDRVRRGIQIAVAELAPGLGGSGPAGSGPAGGGAGAAL